MESLIEAPAGTIVRIRHLQSQPETCHRLRELGFCEDAVIRCITNGSKQLICEVCNTRIGIDHTIARDILISPFE